MADEKYPTTREDGSGNLRNCLANLFVDAGKGSKVRIADCPREVCMAMSHPEFWLAKGRGADFEILLVQKEDESQRKYLGAIQQFISAPDETIRYGLCIGLAYEFAGKDGVADYLLATVKRDVPLTRKDAIIMAEQTIAALRLAA